MSSYQVVCSVTRPPDPTSRCQIREFQEKVPHHLDTVFQDLSLTQNQSGGGSSSSSGQEQSHGEEPHGAEGHCTNTAQLTDDNLMLCAVVSKTSASFSGAGNFQSRVKLPFFWCNVCPFDTESKASLLQHVVSQHCFTCRFCPYLALSRTKVITHSLRQHPQFAQFREQRLKTCHLKRDLFQLHFDPKSDCQHIENLRKRAQWSDSESNEVPPPKYLRRNSSESLPQAEDVEGLHDEEGSSSDSIDDLPLHFSQGRSPEKSASCSNLTACQQGVSLSTYVMENVVSSSGMEPDVGIDQSVITKNRHPEKSQSPAPATPPIPQDMMKEDLLEMENIKEEKECNNADFALALGRTSAEGSNQAGDPSSEDDHASCCSVDVKQEPVDEPPDNVSLLYQKESQQGLILSRQVSSPELSNIRVENLQQQFDESFSVHHDTVTALSTAVYNCEHSEPYPVRLIAQPISSPSQRLVENFLIDPSQSAQSVPEHVDDPSSPSMLRHLLTRPLLHSSQQSPVNKADSVHMKQDGRQAGKAEKPGVQVEEKDADCTSASDVQNNFLLMSDKQFNSEDNPSVSVRILKSPSQPAQEMWIENPNIDIKQEPEDGPEDYSTSLHLITSVSGGSGSAHLRSPVHYALSSVCKRKSSSHLVQSSTSGSQESNWGSPQTCDRSSGERASLAVVQAAEKLKSFSNMSLRDLLTMNTSIGTCPVLKGLAVAPDNGPHTSPATADPASRMESGHVVWECGFCYFEADNKAVVLAHRRLYHARLMKEAGMIDDKRRDSRDTSLAASSVDEEEKLSQEEGEEGDDQVWMDQPSTSSGYHSISQMFSPLSFPPLSMSSGALLNRRQKRARGIYHERDFEYMSDSTVDFDSDPEPDDLDDKTYEPPKSWGLMNILLSSEDEEEEFRKSKSRKAAREKIQRRRSLGKKAMKKDANSGPANKEIVGEKDTDKMKQQKALYRCMACKHSLLNLQDMKDHLRYASDKHLLIMRAVVQPASLLFVCPGFQCVDVKTSVFTEYQCYLVHVLQCQGYIFDVLRSTVQNAAIGRVGYVNCPISSCGFTSQHQAQMQNHLDDHLHHLHLAQMLLFRTICTVMAKMYGGVVSFDRFICYRCSSILIDLPRVLQHMKSDHHGQVRGVLIVTQKTEGKSHGIVVAIQCLQCCERVPSLHLWFTHECCFASWSAGGDAASGLSSEVYNPQPSLPPFQEWVWGQQSSNCKVSASTPFPATTTTAQKETGDLPLSSENQLPLIRSILMSEPRSQQDGEEAKRLDLHSGDLEDEVHALVQCSACQQFMPEHHYLQHSCRGQKVTTVKPEKEVGVQQGASDSATIPSAQQGLSSQHHASAPVDPNISHSRLLAALATHHHNNPSVPAQGAKQFPHSLSTPKPQTVCTTLSLQPVSTVTRSQPIPSVPRSQPVPTVPRSQPVSTDSASQHISTTSRPQSASSTHPSLISLLTKGDKASLNKTADPQSSQSASLPSSRPANHLMDHLAKLQLMHEMKPATSTPVRERSEESPDFMSDLITVRSKLRQKLSDGGQQDDSSSQSLPGVQNVGSSLTVSAGRSDNPPSSSAAAGTQLVEKGGEREKQQEPGCRTSGVLSSPVVSSDRLKVHRDIGVLQACTKSNQPLLMNFLRQQGDQVLQVIGNVVGHQEDLSQS